MCGALTKRKRKKKEKKKRAASHKVRDVLTKMLQTERLMCSQRLRHKEYKTTEYKATHRVHGMLTKTTQRVHDNAHKGYTVPDVLTKAT